MTTTEFRPRLFSMINIFMLMAIVLVDVLLYSTVFIKALNLNKEFPGDPMANQVYYMTLLAMIIPWIIILSIIIFRRSGNKIIIENNLISFKNWSILKGWQMKTFDLSSVQLISERKVTSFAFTGKVLIPIVHYWLVFNYKDGKKDEASIFGWDNETLKNILFLIRGKYSSIKMNNYLLRDNSVDLSGISDILKR